MRTIYIRDLAGTSGVTQVDADSPDEVVAVLTPWFPEAPAEVTATIRDLATALQRQDSARVYEAATYLALGITEHADAAIEDIVAALDTQAALDGRRGPTALLTDVLQVAGSPQEVLADGGWWDYCADFGLDYKQDDPQWARVVDAAIDLLKHQTA